MKMPVKLVHGPVAFSFHHGGCGVRCHESKFKLTKNVAGTSNDPFGTMCDAARIVPLHTHTITIPINAMFRHLANVASRSEVLDNIRKAIVKSDLVAATQTRHAPRPKSNC